MNPKETLKTVLNDPRIRASAKVVYMNLVMAQDGKDVSIGQRLLSSNCGMNHTTVSKGVRQLEQSGYLQVESGKHGRHKYLLNGGKKRKWDPPAPFKPVEAFDLIGIIKCEHCGRWIDVEKCEALTDEVDEQLKSELVDAPESAA